MKKHAQDILQFTGYPLEPIVAFQVGKSLQAQAQKPHATTVSRHILQQVYAPQGKINETDDKWFAHYE